jgi:hypothetical protein
VRRVQARALDGAASTGRTERRVPMKRLWGHVMAGGLLLAGTAAISTACVNDNSTVFIFDVLAQQLVSPGSQCLFTTDPTQPDITSGVLDVGFVDTYYAEFLVGNQIVPQGNASIPQTETSYVQFTSAVVKITDTADHTLANYTEIIGAAALAPAQGTTPSYEPIGVTIVNETAVASVKQAVVAGGTRQLITHTYFLGATLGGESVQTNDFAFPVTLCYGCLVSYSASDVDLNAPIPNCLGAIESASASASSTALPGPCFVGQDDAIDCSQCLGLPVCSGIDTAIAASTDAGTD